MSGRLEAVYERLPRALQDAAVSVEGFRILKRRYGGPYASIRAAIHRQQSLVDTGLQEWRRHKLRAFLVAAQSSPFWAEVFGEYAVYPEGTDPFAELAKLPVLTKQTVKANVARLINPQFRRKSFLWRHTSGTTGSGLIFPETRATECATWAHWWRYRQWHGIAPSMWCAYFGGRSVVPLRVTQPPFWRVNWPGRQVMFSGYHLGSKTAVAYLDALESFRIEWLHGYPSMLTLLAQLAVALGRQVRLPHLKVITTGAENLATWQRNAIASVFGVPVRQHYGQAEAVANISECEHGYLHVDEDFSAVEFVSDSRSSDSYRIIGTNWLNPAFPLLRYDAGDLAQLSTAVCPCGRQGRVVASLDGRREDYLTLPNGVCIGRLDHIFKDMTHVTEAQFVQESHDRVDLLVVRTPQYGAGDERTLLAEIRQRVGTDLEVTLRYVDEIPRGPNGKLRLVVSRIAPLVQPPLNPPTTHSSSRHPV